jgi:hypothetical protein
MNALTMSAPRAKTLGISRTTAGRILTAIPVLFLTFDTVIKFTSIDPVVDSFTQLGYSMSLALGIGVLELVCLVLYVVPRTSVLGAILLTGHLGAAIASHLRVGNPLFSHVLFPVYVAVLLWGGLSLREARLRALVPLRK